MIMTCDERLEKLLNKAGQTISDLPTRYDEYAHSLAAEAAETWSSRITWRRYTDYILHLTDVIDRLEWALDNVTRERDWLREMNRLHAGCQTCAHHADGDPLQCADGKRLCQLGDDGACVSWEYSEMPEDWRADDENPVDA